MDEENQEIIDDNLDFEQMLPLKIYEGDLVFPLPEGFDAYTISVDGRLKSDLDWARALALAEKIVESGKKLLWNFDLGFFKDLVHPLSNQSQFLSLTLSLEYFRDHIWKRFKKSTIGVSIYRGSADFSIDFPWNQEELDNIEKCYVEETQNNKKLLFCRDVAIDYLKLLATRLPDNLPLFLFLDLHSLGSIEEQLKFLNPALFSRFVLFLRGSLLPFKALGWHEPSILGFSSDEIIELPNRKDVSIGILLPSANFSYSFIQGVTSLLRSKQFFKLIAEEQLTNEWDGLDTLFYSPSQLSADGKRKIKGFLAAGGRLVSDEENLIIFQ